jgi:hypothetical protein
MEFEFEVGVREKHQVKLQRNWLTGKQVILVDSYPVATTSPFNLGAHFSVKHSTKHEFSVGDIEKHTVRIERIRPGFFAGCSPHTFRVFVDENLFSEHQGY